MTNISTIGAAHNLDKKSGFYCIVSYVRTHRS